MDGLAIDFGITVLVRLQLPIKSGIWLVNFQVAIALETKQQFETSYAKQKYAER